MHKGEFPDMKCILDWGRGGPWLDRRARTSQPFEDTLHRKAPTFIYAKENEPRILLIAKEAKKRDLTHKDFGQTSFFQDVPQGEKIPKKQKQNMEDMYITHGAVQKSLASMPLYGLVNPHKKVTIELENDENNVPQQSPGDYSV